MKDQKQVRDIQDMTREELLGFLEDAAPQEIGHVGTLLFRLA